MIFLIKKKAGKVHNLRIIVKFLYLLKGNMSLTVGWHVGKMNQAAAVFKMK
jgi:hypothetical protein